MDSAKAFRVTHPYPPHHPHLPYTGKHYYFLTFCADRRKRVFGESETVELVLAQFLRAAADWRFEITAYCFMPDHVHALAYGLADEADCKRFIKGAKQYSAYYFRKRHGYQLWQRYGFERVLRDDTETAFVIGYIITNPVRSGLVENPSEYPYLGSQRYTIPEMLQMCAQLDSTCFRLKAEATRLNQQLDSTASA